MDRRDRQPIPETNVVFAVARWLLTNLRLVLIFFENEGLHCLEKFVHFLFSHGGELSRSVTEGLCRLCKGELVHEINNYVKGLLRFSTRNRGQVRFVEHSLGDITDVLQDEVFPDRVRRQVDDNYRNLRAARLEERRNNAEPSTSEENLDDSFEAEMDRRLNDSATHVGPVRQFGGYFSRAEASDRNADASSSSSSEFGFPPIEMSSLRPTGEPSNVAETRMVPQGEESPSTPQLSDDELESLSEFWETTENDDGSQELLVELEEQMSSLRVESPQPSTSQQAYSQPTVTAEMPPNIQTSSDSPKKVVPFSQTHSQNYFVSEEMQAEQFAIDFKKELFQKVQQAIANDPQIQSEDSANARRIFDQLGVVPAMNQHYEAYHPKMSSSNNYYDGTSSGGCGTSTMIPHCSQSLMPSWDQCDQFTDDYDENYEQFSDDYEGNWIKGHCPICTRAIFSNHEILRCVNFVCAVQYHAKCLAFAAHQNEKCRHCKARLRTTRDPFE